MPRTESLHPRTVCAVFFALTLLALGCSPKLDIPAGAQIQCGEGGSCPTGSVCQTAINLCVAEGNLGSGPPALDGAPGIDTPYLAAGKTVTVTLTSNKPLIGAPELWAEGHGQKLALTLDSGASSGNSYTFHYTATGEEKEGIVSLFVKLIDQNGNVANGLPAGAFTLDFTPPEVIFPKVEYVPSDTNPLGPGATAATQGTTVRVKVTANEDLDPTSEPQLVATLGTTQLTFTRTGFTAEDATFEATLAPGTTYPDGVYVPSLAGWKDAAGNVSTASSFSDPQIRVLTTPPTLAVKQDQVEYLRSPWGNAAAETLDGGLEIPAGPYFALAPPDPLGTATTLPADTFLLGGGKAPARIQIWADDRSENLLGTTTPNPDGSWPRLRLASLDVPAVYATGLDVAGNASSPVRLTQAEWVATLRPPVFGSSPHLLRGIGAVTAALEPEPGRALGQVDPAVNGADATALLQRAEVTWHDETVTAAGPTQRMSPAMAFDPQHGAVYLFGGERTNVTSDELWRWESGRWTQVPKSGAWPPARKRSAMAYDASRNRLVLFAGGGVGSSLLDDLWEWDGATWTQAAQAGAWPVARTYPGLAYDAERARIVLYGGSTETGSDGSVWEWDGTSWQEHPAAGSAPSPRFAANLTYDTARGQLLLFGGADFSGACGTGFCADTWAWDGTTWTQLAPATVPPARAAAAMTYDGLRDRVVLFGGISSGNLQDVWEWDGANWTDRTPASGPQPAARYSAAMAFDPISGRAVLFGDDQATDPTTWEWDGAAWTQSVVLTVGTPAATLSPGMAFDSTRGRVVLFGGTAPDGSKLDVLWEHDGTQWINRTPTTRPASWPSARYGSTLVHDPIRQRDVLFGGVPGTGAVNQVWEWDGASWLNRTPPGTQTQPVGTSGDPMVFDGAQSVLFSSSESGVSSASTEVWSWNGTSWTSNWEYQTGPHPSARDGAAAAFDPIRGVSVFYGGRGPSGSLGDVWDWNGSAWTEKTPSGPTPPAREFGSMAFDPNRGQVVLFGGTHMDASGSEKLQDLWGWDGTAWTDLTPRALKPSARDQTQMVFDGALQRLMVYGGASESDVTLGDTWTLAEGNARSPGLQFTVHGALAQLGSVTGLRVRARCGGTSYLPTPADGATLLGWSTAAGTKLPVGWTLLEANTVAANDVAPFLPATADALLDWKAASPAEARRYVLPEDALHFQCRAAGASEAGGQEARVAMDYIEARVQYATQEGEP